MRLCVIIANASSSRMAANRLMSWSSSAITAQSPRETLHKFSRLR
jgi:hypothetical protein